MQYGGADVTAILGTGTLVLTANCNVMKLRRELRIHNVVFINTSRRVLISAYQLYKQRIQVDPGKSSAATGLFRTRTVSATFESE